MFAKNLSLLCVVAIVAFGGVAQAALVTDDFTADRNYLTSGTGGTIWNGIHNQSAASTLNTTSTPDQLTIGVSTGAGGVGWNGTYFNAPFLYRNVTGDFDARVKATGGTTNNWSIAALMVRLDPPSADGNAGEDFALISYNWFGNNIQVRTVDDNAQNDSFGTTAQPYLRLTRTGNVLRAYSSSDGSAWTPLSWGGQLGPVIGNDLTRSDLGGTVQLGLTHGSFQAANSSVQFDDFQATVPDPPAGDIPEPATMALLGFGVAGVGGYIRRRRTA